MLLRINQLITRPIRRRAVRRVVWEAALKMHLDGAPEGVSGCNPVQSLDATEPLEDKDESNLVQSGATGGMVGARGLEPRTRSPADAVIERGGAERPAPE